MDNSSGKGMGGWVEAAGCTALPERMREEEEGLVWLVLLGNTVVVGYRSTTTVRERRVGRREGPLSGAGEERRRREPRPRSSSRCKQPTNILSPFHDDHLLCLPQCSRFLSPSSSVSISRSPSPPPLHVLPFCLPPQITSFLLPHVFSFSPPPPPAHRDFSPPPSSLAVFLLQDPAAGGGEEQGGRTSRKGMESLPPGFASTATYCMT